MGSFSSAGKRKVCVLVGTCIGFSFLMPVEAKRLSFQLPVQDKLIEGSGPNSADNQAKKPQSLAPVGLGDESDESSTEDGGVLKSTVRQDQYLAKTSQATSDAAKGKKESVIGRKGEKLTKEKPVDVGPLALIESDTELEKKAETQGDAEKRQLSELWQSTISRNPDIQFVINKLQPTTDQGHAMATTMKFLSATLFSAMNMAPMMMPGGMMGGANMMPAMGVMSGGNLIQGLFQDKAAKNAKKNQVSQEQATILYKIVRDTADKLVTSFRDYKKEMTSLERATADLQDLQSMVAEARSGQSAPQQIEMEYTLRKAKREIEEKSEQARLHRQQLSDLAGGEAVEKLDTDMIAERNALANLINPNGSNGENSAGGPFVNPLQVPPQQTSNKPATGIDM